MDGIYQDVSEAFTAAPHRGAETGGILLGRREEDRLVIEDFEPVPSDHRFGPSYRLSDNDRELLRETLQWSRNEAPPGLSVLGFYRGHTLSEFALSQEDEDLLRSEFAGDEDLVLLVRPGLMGSSPEDFFIRRCAGVAAAAPTGPPPVDWPAPRARLDTEERRRATSRWPWYIAAGIVGLIFGAAGYLWLHPVTGAAQVPVRLPATAASSIPAPAPVPKETTVEGAAAPAIPPAPDIAGVRELLDRWSAALKRGDLRTVAQCYAPVVGTYFTHHDVAREAVRLSLQLSRERYGRLDIYRISGLGITPVSDNRAVVTFRKRWKTSGRARSSGEEQERMTMVRNQGAWQISSEQTVSPR